jgi:hypothetical protein
MKALGANTKQNIQVMVRVRPLNHRELKANDKNCIEVPAEQEECLILDSKPESKVFSYDCVWGEKSSQENIFEKIGKPMADRSLEGYNCTVFAYGQTGSGKTFTMQGKGIDRFVKGDPSVGLQPRVLDYIFSRVREADPQRTNITVKCSYIEIYNEQITDLLNPAAKNLQIREDARKGPFLKDVEEVIQTKEEAFELMMMGLKNRTVASTDMNDESSRSHTVFTLVIEQTSDESGLAKIKTGKINFVDLAGSERQKATNTAGERLKEAGGINRSLTILGGVINSLVTQTEGKSVHVRYRDSKLTFLLKDSLGGNTMTAIIANISPSSDNFGETLSTLKFAQRAKLIQNKAVVNEESSGTSDSLKNEISRLNMIIAEMSVRPPAHCSSSQQQ